MFVGSIAGTFPQDLLAGARGIDRGLTMQNEPTSKNIDGISSVTAETAAGTHEIARAAEDLDRLTHSLQDLVDQFKVDGAPASMHAPAPAQRKHITT